jgi:uncharacterized phage protein gp47/JayE
MSDELAPIDLASVLSLDDAVANTTGSDGFGITDGGFVPKPYARILTEKLALARAMLGADLDLTTGSVIRKLLELSALEDARTWAALCRMYDDQFVASAAGNALTALGTELGVVRPFLNATGTVALTYSPPEGVDTLTIPQGARMLTTGGHHAATLTAVTLTRNQPTQPIDVQAFYPGPDSNLDPSRTDPDGSHPMQLVQWNPDDSKLEWNGASPGLLQLAEKNGVAPESIVAIAHTAPLSGGQLGWSDARYRTLLLQAPRTLWSASGIRLAASLVPGVRQVQVLDALGGLDVDLPVFGQFRFGESLFAKGRDLLAPHHVDVLIAATPSAITGEVPGNVSDDVAAAIENLRPVGVGVRVYEAEEVFVAISATITTTGLPIPRSAAAQITSSVANDLKQRLLARVASYVTGLEFGDPVRYAEVMWALMNEPGVSDVSNLLLMRYPALNSQVADPQTGYQTMPLGENIVVAPTQIAFATTDDTKLSLA